MAFNGQYGLSLTLAPDYWYLRGFDAKSMEQYVDFFGFMAYVSLIPCVRACVRTCVRLVRPCVRSLSNLG